MIEREVTTSPGFARPRAWRAAMLEFDPVPQGERSARPVVTVEPVQTAQQLQALYATVGWY